MSERVYDERAVSDLIQYYQNGPPKDGSGTIPLSHDHYLECFVRNLENFYLYQDNSLIILNKPPGILAHCSDDHTSIGVEEVLRYEQGNPAIRLVHRIDRDTSGILLLAKSAETYYFLKQQFDAKTSWVVAGERYRDTHEPPALHKQYLAVLDGSLKKAQEIYVGIEYAGYRVYVRENQDDKNIRQSLTEVRPQKIVTDGTNQYTIADVEIFTGRKHQIRAVLSYIGHPVTGDYRYGSKSSIAERQLLHAKKIEFIHPETKMRMSFTAPTPEDIQPFTTLRAVTEWFY